LRAVVVWVGVLSVACGGQLNDERVGEQRAALTPSETKTLAGAAVLTGYVTSLASLARAASAQVFGQSLANRAFDVEAFKWSLLVNRGSTDAMISSSSRLAAGA
jgi:hypothetical protein